MCVHHEIVDPSDQVCRCEAVEGAHWHGKCQLCGAERTYPVWVDWDYRTSLEAVTSMVGHWRGG